MANDHQFRITETRILVGTVGTHAEHLIVTVPEVVSVAGSAEGALAGQFRHLPLCSPTKVEHRKDRLFARVDKVLNVPALNIPGRLSFIIFYHI